MIRSHKAILVVDLAIALVLATLFVIPDEAVAHQLDCGGTFSSLTISPTPSGARPGGLIEVTQTGCPPGSIWKLLWLDYTQGPTVNSCHNGGSQYTVMKDNILADSTGMFRVMAPIPPLASFPEYRPGRICAVYDRGPGFGWGGGYTGLYSDIIWGPPESKWAAADNAAAKPDLLSTFNIKFPVAGYALPGAYEGEKASDDFCFDRTYANAACISGTGHSGNDHYPIDLGNTPGFGNSLGLPDTGNGVLPVVAARTGTVVEAGCTEGLGTMVVVRANDGHTYRYLHMSFDSIPTDVVLLGQVVAGQKLGLLDDEELCPGGAVATHLHFDMWQTRADGTAKRGTDARDPYRSLRARFTRPGSRVVSESPYATEATPNSLLMKAWFRALGGTSFGASTTHAQNIALVGWPVGATRASDGYVYNPNWYRTSSRTGTGYAGAGYKQFLGTGRGVFDGKGRMRAGVLTQADSASEGFWVHGLIYKRYSEMVTFDAYDEEDSFLGWPTSFEYRDSRGLVRQDFEGGCIADNGTGKYRPAAYGTSPCS